MDIQAVLQKAEELMINRRIRISRERGYSYNHGIRVAKIALTLRRQLFPKQAEYDDIITAAGYFHDIGKGIEPHNRYGAVLTREALGDICTEDELNLICEIVENHNNKNNVHDNHFTSKLIQDADSVEWTGSNCVWLELYYYITQNATSLDYIAEIRPYHKPEQMIFNYDLSKRIFIDRVKYQSEFIKRINSEARDEIYGLEDLL